MGSKINNYRYSIQRASPSLCEQTQYHQVSMHFYNPLPLAFSLSKIPVTSEGLLSPGLGDSWHSGREKMEIAKEMTCHTV